MTYLLEVYLAREVIDLWSEPRDGRTPSGEKAVDAVLHYATYDSDKLP
jgi:hypothetical protein